MKLKPCNDDNGRKPPMKTKRRQVFWNGLLEAGESGRNSKRKSKPKRPNPPGFPPGVRKRVALDGACSGERWLENDWRFTVSPPRVPSKPEEYRALGVHGGGTTYKFVVGRHGLAAFVHFKVSLPPSVQFYWLLFAHTLFLSLSASFLLRSLFRPWCLPPLPRISTGHVQRAHCCDPCWKNENTSWTSPWRSSSLT